MSDTGLMITDEYVNERTEYFQNQGERLQSMMDSYLAIMRTVTDEGVVKGETSETLLNLLRYAERLDQVILDTSEEIIGALTKYLEEIDAQDQYLY